IYSHCPELLSVLHSKVKFLGPPTITSPSHCIDKGLLIESVDSSTIQLSPFPLFHHPVALYPPVAIVCSVVVKPLKSGPAVTLEDECENFAPYSCPISGARGSFSPDLKPLHSAITFVKPSSLFSLRSISSLFKGLIEYLPISPPYRGRLSCTKIPVISPDPRGTLLPSLR